MSFGAMFRRKHSELKGELSNLYNHEEKLLSEVCYYMASVQGLCTFSLIALIFKHNWQISNSVLSNYTMCNQRHHGLHFPKLQSLSF
jgi:hypothetical protein